MDQEEVTNSSSMRLRVNVLLQPYIETSSSPGSPVKILKVMEPLSLLNLTLSFSNDPADLATVCSTASQELERSLVLLKNLGFALPRSNKKPPTTDSASNDSK